MNLGRHTLLYLLVFACGMQVAQAQANGPEIARLKAAVVLARAAAPTDTTLANSLWRLADGFQAAGAYLEAEAALLEAMRTVRGRERRNALREADFLVSLGKFYWTANRPKQAEAYADSALVIVRLIGGEAAAPLVAPLLLKAALAYDRGDFDAAEARYREAGLQQEKAEGPQSADLAETLNNLGAVLVAQNKLERALLTYRHALNMQESVLGKGHVATSATLTNIGSVLDDLGEFKEAEALLRRAYGIRAAQLPPGDARTGASIDNLVTLLVGLGRAADAHEFLSESHKSLEERVEPVSLPVAAFHDRWAAYYLAIEKPKEAEAHMMMALDIREALLPALDPAIGNSLLNLGKLHNLEGQHAQAVIDLNRSMESFSENVFVCEDALTAILGELFTAHFAQGQNELAETALNKLLDIKVAVYGEMDSQVVEVLLLMQRFFRETDQPQPLQEVQLMLRVIEEAEKSQD